MASIFKLAGGPVRENEIYIERQADHDVWQLVRALDYAHLIAPRQTGKTSLLHRLRKRLLASGWRCAYVDLGELDPAKEKMWYAILGNRLDDQLQPLHSMQIRGPNDIKPYFNSILQKGAEPQPIVVLFDEIGRVASLPSAESFFYVLRSMYGEPADYSALKNFTLVLAGAIDPDTLVENSGASPFNYGERIFLPDFTAAETRELTERLRDVGLQVNNGVHNRIYYWTNGQPYLTQKICAILERQCAKGLASVVADDIDQVVYEYLLSPVKRDSNLNHIRKGLRSASSLRSLAERLITGEFITHDHEVAYDLYLLGLITYDPNGFLAVRNRVYQEAIAASSMSTHHIQSFINAYAFLIGVGDYTHLRFANLPATVRDAQITAAVLTDPARCGYSPNNVQVIIGEQATATNIRAALKSLAQSTNSQSTVFLYFSGHGGRALENGTWRAYLCPREADPDDLAHTAISGDEFSALLAAIPARKLLVMLDACHAAGSAELKAADGTVVWKAGLPDDYYEALSQGSGRVIIASSKEEQFSYARGELSLFTNHLVQALNGRAAVRGDGLIHVLDVFHYVNEAVQADEPKQVPILKVKDLDLNFPIALDRGGKGVGPAISVIPIADIREQVVRDPISGAKALSEYLKTRPEWAVKRSEVDLKRADLERIQHDLDLFGPNPADQAAKNRAIFFLLRACLELERPEQ